MLANEITDYYLEHSQPTLNTSVPESLNLPIIESWVPVDVHNQVVIRGQIHNHPKYPTGKQLKSSPIQGYLTKSGRVFVTTKNSIYELGTPHPAFMSDAHFSMSNRDNHPIEKLTYWED